MKTNKFITHFFILTLLLLCRYSYAEPNGTCWSSLNYIATFNSASFSGNKAGATATTSFGDTNSYSITCAPNPERLLLNYSQAFFEEGSNSDGNTLHLTDDVDVTIKMNTDGSGNKTSVPFYNLYVSGGIVPPTNGGTATASYGKSATVTFTLRKNVIGGAIFIPPGVTLYKYYRSVYEGVYAGATVVKSTTQGQIIPVTTECTINNGQTISVPFGDIEGMKLKSDGPSSVIKKDIQLNYSCTSSLTQDIEITLVGSTASFESTALSSSIADVGVVMMHDGTPVKPYDHFMSKLVNGTGSDTITFAPIIRSGATNVQGNFTASATLVMTSA